MSQTRNIYVIKGHMTIEKKKHRCYFISLVSTETPSMKTVCDQVVADPKADLSYWLSLGV